ncbi:hypothetical protein [Thalassomonas sp. RHCl1]|uniref:hypothetical protein n=1 Tax=Thalassomonas sp. RHCl1 TaxID=2995320 RepID=UPI00248B5B78|nr:hypothetical protein [Thalassomonas sp. RHCl1]
MGYFSISRIHTSLGIFRLTGHWRCQSYAVEGIRVETLDILGTDGWLALALEKEAVKTLIGELTSELLAHLLEKEQVCADSRQT